VAGRTVAGAALAFCGWIGDCLELAAGSLAGARRGPPVVASSRYGQELEAAPGVLARQATGQAPGAVHAEGALELGALGGVLARRQAHRQRVGGQDCQDLGQQYRQGGERPSLSSPYRLLLHGVF